MFQQKLKRYFGYLSMTLIAMGVYRIVLVPAIEPPKQPLPPLYSSFDPIDQKLWWNSIFPADAWQNDSPKALRTPQVTLLFKELKQLDPESWQLAPLTMLVPLKMLSKRDNQVEGGPQAGANHAGENLVMIDAPEGAVIQFQGALDWTSGKMPPIVGGHLVGPIRIKNVAGTGQTVEPWELSTRDVRIERRRVWTIESVEMRFRDGIVRGRDLSIYLKQDLLASNGSAETQWGLLDHLDLIYVERVAFGLPPGGLWASMPMGGKPAKLESEGGAASIELQCAGRFRFDFNRSEAILRDRVHIVHAIDKLPPDQVWCDQLIVAAELESTKSGSSKTNTLRLGPLLVKSLEALGTDAVSPQPVESLVRIEAPNIDADLQCKRMLLDAQEHQIDLEGRLNQRAPPTIVKLKYMGHEFLTPMIQYRAAVNAEHLGWMYAEGPGEIRTSGESEIGQWQARWDESLRMKPDGAMHWIILNGQSIVESPRQGHLAGNTIELWLAKALNTTRTGDPMRQPKDAYLVDHLHAQGGVVLGTTAQVLRVDNLYLAMVYPQVDVAESTQSEPPELQLNGFHGPPRPPPVAQPKSAGNQLAQSHQSQQPTPIMPIAVRGKVLRSRVIMVEGQSWIDDLTMVGPLTIVRDGGESHAGQTDWRIEGSQLRTETNAAGQANLQIVGEPAVISVGQGWLKGPIIRLDQKSGLVWMDQPGSFSIPTDLMLSQAPDSKIQWLNPPKCNWNGRMIFDGSIARVEGGVTLDGAFRDEAHLPWLVSGNCEALDIRLTQPIDLAKPSSRQTTLSDVTLRGSVDIRASRTDQHQHPLSRMRLVVPKLTFEVAKNRLIGDGPGWIRSRHFTPSKPGQLASLAPGESAQPLQGVHLKFRSALEAWLAKSEISFLGKVEVGMGPIKSLDDDLDLDNMRRLQTGQTLLSGDLLQARDLSHLSTTATMPASTSGAWEFLAKGNVVFESKSEGGDASGNANEVTYTQPKDLLVIKSDGRTPARLRRSPVSPAPISGADILIDTASLNIRTMEIIDSKVREINITPANPNQGNAQLPSSSPPARPRNGVSEFLKGHL